jgi:hypothetical protein
MLSEHEIYVKVKELLATEEQWTQGHYAKNTNGTPVGYTSEDACSFCLLGALDKTVQNLICRSEIPSLCVAINEKLNAMAGNNDDVILSEFNDTHTYEEVIAVLDRAIELSGGTQDA